MPEKNSRLALSTLVLIILFLPGFVSAESPRVLRGGYIDFPPLTYTDASGQAAGEGIELTNRILREASLEVTWQEYPLGRIYHSFRHNLIDLWPGTAGVPSIQPYVLETKDAPGIKVRLYAYHLESVPPIESLEQIRNKRLILIRGYTYLSKLNSLRKANKDIVTAPNHRSALRLLAMGRGDYLLDFGRPLEAAEKTVTIEGLQRSLLDQWRVALVVSKSLEGAGELVEQLDRSFMANFAGQCESETAAC
ncbi:MAG: transporter substrate-binding domain-containing protein [Pseudomonadota bacterium]|nr:transporter substrate-binding domain-containing protein [Pseudomonadota bacterium]